MDLHGGNTYKQEREGKNIKLDYSSNINPLGITEELKNFLIKNLNLAEKYPDPDYIKLRKEIAKFYKLSIDNIIVGNGATEILFLYINTLKPKKTLLIAPCFSEYERALKNNDSEILYFELKEEENFKFNLESFNSFVEKNQIDLVILCNPNNPTGTFIELETIKKISKICKTKNIKLFIDEAFIDFVENYELKNASLLKDENIFIMRALTKFFAMPGLRLGFGICFDKNLLSNMNFKKETWSVNIVAELSGIFMLNDKNYITKTKNWIKEEKKYFYRELIKNKNLKVYKTEVNFILIKLLNETSNNLREKMISDEILIRDASNFKFLNEHFIRLAIKDRRSNDLVLKSINKFLGS